MSERITGLERFLRAQELNYPRALSELAAGSKRSHWIWYTLPQLRGLGTSHLADFYGIQDQSEALEYLAHPVLGPRLVECVITILDHKGRAASEILGDVDALKFRSCLTLFDRVAPYQPVFALALSAFYAGEPDEETLRRLEVV